MSDEMIKRLQASVRQMEEAVFRSAFGPPDDDTATAAAMRQNPLRAEDVIAKVRQIERDFAPYRRQAARMISDYTMLSPVSMRVLVGPEPWPQEQKGVETAHLQAHPLIRWLARFLPITPTVAYQRPRMVDKGPYSLPDGTMVVSSRQYEDLKRSIPEAA